MGESIVVSDAALDPQSTGSPISRILVPARRLDLFFWSGLATTLKRETTPKAHQPQSEAGDDAANGKQELDKRTQGMLERYGHIVTMLDHLDFVL